MPLVYALTAAGQDALTAEPDEQKLPNDYRRLLGMIEVGGHEDVIKGRLRRFPEKLIGEWLKELEELKYVESHEAGELDAITFTGAALPPQPPLTDDDRKRLAKTTVIGGATLLRSGSFLAADRVANIPPLKKTRSETVIGVPAERPSMLAALNVGFAPTSSPRVAAAPVSPKTPSRSRSHANVSGSAAPAGSLPAPVSWNDPPSLTL